MDKKIKNKLSGRKVNTGKTTINEGANKNPSRPTNVKPTFPKPPPVPPKEKKD